MAKKQTTESFVEKAKMIFPNYDYSKTNRVIKLSTEQYITICKEKHDDFYSYDKTVYTNSRSKIIVTCPVHGDFITTPKYHLGTKTKSPMGCSECIGSISVGSIRVRKYLIDNEISYKTEQHLNCKNPKTDSYLYFDFWLPDHNLLIEFDGKQHFKSVPQWGGENGLQENQYRDSIKTQYAKDNNIKLIRIHYKDINKIVEILKEEIK